MAYSKTNWLDRIVQFANRYTKSGESSSEVTLVQSPGTVTQAGTAVNAANLNKMEQGIADAHATADAALPINGSKPMTGDLSMGPAGTGAGSYSNTIRFHFIDAGGVKRTDRVLNVDPRGDLVFTQQGVAEYPIWDARRLRDNAGVLEFFTSGAWKPVGGVKSIQRGQTTVTGSLTDNIVNVPISAVNLSKSLVHISYASDMTGTSNTAGRPPARASLTSATNLELLVRMMGVSSPNSAMSVFVSWQVVEYY